MSRCPQTNAAPAGPSRRRYTPRRSAASSCCGVADADARAPHSRMIPSWCHVIRPCVRLFIRTYVAFGSSSPGFPRRPKDELGEVQDAARVGQPHAVAPREAPPEGIDVNVTQLEVGRRRLRLRVIVATRRGEAEGDHHRESEGRERTTPSFPKTSGRNVSTDGVNRECAARAAVGGGASAEHELWYVTPKHSVGAPRALPGAGRIITSGGPPGGLCEAALAGRAGLSTPSRPPPRQPGTSLFRCSSPPAGCPFFWERAPRATLRWSSDVSFSERRRDGRISIERGESFRTGVTSSGGEEEGGGAASRELHLENERGPLVEHPVKFSTITLQGGLLARFGAYGWIEHDKAVLERPSKLNSDLRKRMMEYVSS